MGQEGTATRFAAFMMNFVFALFLGSPVWFTMFVVDIDEMKWFSGESTTVTVDFF